MNLLCFGIIYLCVLAASEVIGKPNIVFVLLDDVGSTDLFNKNSVVKTNFMWSLLKNGIMFRQVCYDQILLINLTSLPLSIILLRPALLQEHLC